MTSRVRTVLRRPGRMAQLLRYSAVSGISTVTSLTILGVLVGLFGVDAVLANVLATAVGTVPSFELNRRWVWFDQSQRSVLRQITPFCTLSFAGLVISTLTVRVRLCTHDRPQSRVAHPCGGGGQCLGLRRAVGGAVLSVGPGAVPAPSSIGWRRSRCGAPRRGTPARRSSLRRWRQPPGAPRVRPDRGPTRRLGRCRCARRARAPATRVPQ